LNDKTTQSAAARPKASVPEDILASASILYYSEGLTQQEIAVRMSVSRATVVNYLKLAREQNIVDIRIRGASFASGGLSRALKERFGLADVYVAENLDPETGEPAQARAAVNSLVARVGAMALHDILKPDDRLGIAWGETMQYLANHLPAGIVERLSVYQLVGSMKSPLMFAAETCAIRIASRFNADIYTLHAPAVLSTATLAKALRDEPVIKGQLDNFARLTCNLFSVGSCDPESHIVQSSIASMKDLEWYRNRGAVAVLCGRFIDADGAHITGELDERIIGITPEEMRSCSRGILVAGGASKLEAIRAVLAGGYATHLVIDAETGQTLLD
jgi:deoxyribonucleoside regulator